MTTMIVHAESERQQSEIPRIKPRTPPLAYRLQNVVYVADRGFGVTPRYAIEFEDSDGAFSSLEFETNDGLEALKLASQVFEERNYSKRGLRVEFVGPADLTGGYGK